MNKTYSMKLRYTPTDEDDSPWLLIRGDIHVDDISEVEEEIESTDNSLPAISQYPRR